MLRIFCFWLFFLSGYVGEVVIEEKEVVDSDEVFPFEELEKEDTYSSDLHDEENLSTLSQLLQSNIEQWKLAETQMLDPEIHLAMPDVYTPLRQLYMSLEILANIYVTQGDILLAKDAYEKACPLTELLYPPESDVGFSLTGKLQDSFQSRISPTGDPFVGQVKQQCWGQLREVYSTLRMDDTYRNELQLEAIAKPYRRLRAEFELRKFLNALIVGPVGFNSEDFIVIKTEIFSDINVFVRRYLENLDGKMTTLLDIFEQVIQSMPEDEDEYGDKNANDSENARKREVLHDLFDQCMDVLFKYSWKHSDLYSASGAGHSTLGGTENELQAELELATVASTSSSVASTTSPTKGPSLAAAPAPSVVSPTTLEPVVGGTDALITATAGFNPMELSSLLGNSVHLKDRDESQGHASQRFVPGTSELMFHEDGSLTRSMMDHILRLVPEAFAPNGIMSKAMEENILKAAPGAFAGTDGSKNKPTPVYASTPNPGSRLLGDMNEAQLASLGLSPTHIRAITEASNAAKKLKLEGNSKHSPVGRKEGLKKRLKRLKREEGDGGTSEEMAKEDLDGMVGDNRDPDDGCEVNQTLSLSESEDSKELSISGSGNGSRETMSGSWGGSSSDGVYGAGTGAVRGGFSRRPTPVIPNATANAPPPALQMNLVFWQWVRMQAPQPTPLANVKVEAPTPSHTSLASTSSSGAGSGSSSNSQGGRMDMRLNAEAAGVLFESSTTAGQNAAPRAAVSNVRANSTAVMALVFSIIALCLGVAYLNYTHQTTSALRRKPKRTPKRTFAQYAEDLFQSFVQVCEEVVYPFLCYLVKQLAGVFVYGYSKLVESLSRKATSVHTAGGSKSGGGGKHALAISTGGGAGSGGKKSNSPLSSNPSNNAASYTASSSSRSSANGSSKRKISLSAPTSSAGTSTNTPTSPITTTTTATTPPAGRDKDSDSGSSGSGCKQVRFTKDTAPPTESVAGSRTSTTITSSSSSNNGDNSGDIGRTGDCTDNGVSKKTPSATLPAPVVTTPSISSSSKSGKPPPSSTRPSLSPTFIPVSDAVVAKKATPSFEPGKALPTIVASSTKKEKDSPKSVVQQPPTSASHSHLTPITVGKKKNKSSSSSSSSAAITTAPTHTSTPAPPELVKQSQNPAIVHLPVSSGGQKNAWKKVVEKTSVPQSSSPRVLSSQASADSYDELLNFIKRTTVDSISIDEDEENSSTATAVLSKKQTMNGTVKAPKGLSAKATKPFPFPSPLIINNTSTISLTPSCDISPHSALRIAPGISSELFNGGGAPMPKVATNTTSTVSSSSPISSGTSLLARSMQGSPQSRTKPSSSLSPASSSSPLATTLVPELDKAPCEIAPGLSAMSLLPPLAVENSVKISSSSNTGSIRKSNSASVTYERQASSDSYSSSALSNSLLVSLNESSEALGGLGFSPTDPALKFTSNSEGGGGLDMSMNMDRDGLDLYGRASSSLFGLNALDSLYGGGSGSGGMANGGGGLGFLGPSGQTQAQSPPQHSASKNMSNNNDDDINFQEFFSDLSSDSPVFCSVHYPATVSTPPGMSRRGVKIPPDNASGAGEGGSDSLAYGGGFRGGGLSLSPPTEGLRDFHFSGQSVLGGDERERGSGSNSSAAGIGYGLFGNANSFGGHNGTQQHQHYQDLEEETMFWKKNSQKSNLLLNSTLSMLTDDDNVDGSGHGNGHHLNSDMFDDETDKFDDLLLRYSEDDGELESPSTGCLLGVNGITGGAESAPPGFSVGSAVGGGLMAYAPHNSGIGNGISSNSTGDSPQRVLTRSRGGSQGDRDSDVQDMDRDNDRGSSAIITLSFTVRCTLDFHHPMQVASVRMASSLFGRWHLDNALPMRCSLGNTDVYGLNVEVPMYLPYFTFKYVITDVEGRMWMEQGPPVVMDISQRQHLEQRRQGHQHQLNSLKMTLRQEDVLRSYVSVPQGTSYLYTNNEYS